jgi:hypothetical protein
MNIILTSYGPNSEFNTVEEGSIADNLLLFLLKTNPHW